MRPTLLLERYVVAASVSKVPRVVFVSFPLRGMRMTVWSRDRPCKPMTRTLNPLRRGVLGVSDGAPTSSGREGSGQRPRGGGHCDGGCAQTTSSLYTCVCVCVL